MIQGAARIGDKPNAQVALRVLASQLWPKGILASGLKDPMPRRVGALSMLRLAEQLQAVVVHQDRYFLKTFVRRATQLTGACTMRLPFPSLQATGTVQLGRKLRPGASCFLASEVDDTFEGPENVDWPRLREDVRLGRDGARFAPKPSLLRKDLQRARRLTKSQSVLPET